MTRRENIRIEHIRGTTRMISASQKLQKKILHGHVVKAKEEHIVRRMLVVESPGKRRRWKVACRRAMIEAGDAERVTTRQTGHQGGIRSSAVSTTSDGDEECWYNNQRARLHAGERAK